MSHHPHNFHTAPDGSWLQELGGFEYCWNYNGGTVVKKGKGKEIRRIELDTPRGKEAFYLKKRGFDGVAYLLRCLFAGRKPHHVCSREVAILQTLQEVGISTMEPVAWGEEKIAGGIPRRGVALYREVAGECARDLFLAGDKPFRRQMAGQLGHLLGILHLHGFYDPLRLQDLICPPGEELQLVVIDREGPLPGPRPFSKPHLFRAMARWCYHVFDAEPLAVTSQEIACFLQNYIPPLKSHCINKDVLIEEMARSYLPYIKSRHRRERFRAFRKKWGL